MTIEISDRALRLVAAHVDAATMRAAIAEVRQDRVHLVKALPWPVVGRVRDGRREEIATVDYLGVSGRLQAECTCGAARCVHVAATALLVFAAEEEAGVDHREAARQAVVGTWLAGLAQVAAPALVTPPSERVVAYVLERRGGELGLTVMQCTRLRRGGLGAGSVIASLGDPARGAPAWVDVEDLRRIALLRAVTKVAPATTLLPLGRVDDALLRELAETGRLCWLDPRRRPLRYGKAETRALAWVEVDGEPGCYRMAVDDGLVIVPARSCHYVDPGLGLLGPLDVGAASEVVASLISGPPVPAAMRATVARSLAPLLRGGVGELGALGALGALGEPGEAVAVPAAGPPLTVALEVAVDDTRTERSGLRISAEARYGEARFGLAAWDADRPVARDLVAEGRLLGRLETLLATLPHGRAGAATSLEFLVNARHMAQVIVPTLRAEGWRVDLAADFPVEAPVADVTWTERLRPQRERPAWFALELGVTIAGRTVPLLPILLDAIRTGQLSPTLDGGAAYTGAGVNLRLPDGELVHVPAERMARWLRPLVELQLGALDDAGALVIPGLAAARLAEGLPDLAAPDAAGALAAARAELDGLLTLAPRREGAKFGGTLRDYQRVGVGWLRVLHDAGLGGLLADEMGLGKTVQVLAFLDGLPRRGAPALVVAPRSMLGTWQREAARFTPKLRTVVHVGGERGQAADAFADAAVVITSYQTLVRDRALLAAVRWRTVIFDEAQALKNPETQVREVAAALSAASRFAITGTPIENHLGELWSLMDLLVPGLLGRAASFGAVFRRAIEKHGNGERLALLRQRIAPFLLRRTKATVELELPPRTEVVESVELDGAQRDLYETLRLRLDAKLETALTQRGLAGASIAILDALLKLRQCCCDPRLVAADEPSTAPSAKLERLMAMLEELVENGRAVIVFSQFSSMLELIAAACAAAELPAAMLTGQTRDRDAAIAKFQDGAVPIFLVSLKAGGVGLTLTRADTVIHYDPWWNPAAEAQATARAHRIGQTRPVMVYKLVARGTVEEGILAMQEDKQRLGDAALLDGGVTALSVTDLQALYRGG